ncbi:MAG: ATP synthase F1 subunit delta [bacterium TMED46]|nr:MAG: ATP synthase F1 subunit delta [bacterium TMED46]|tara:strand:+ start:11407 stop:11946 length:540 start_codon:yes stop_codon:yes gene_type:complete
MKHKLRPKELTMALFSVSEKNQVLEEVRNALLSLSGLASTNSYFRLFFQSKKIAVDQKVDILNKLLGDQGHPLVNELVSYLNTSTALSDLKIISKLFDTMFKDNKNILSVHGTVAQNMTESEIESLRSSLGQLLGREMDITIDIDPSLIGGIKLRIDNTFLDASIQNQLQSLHSKLLQT